MKKNTIKLLISSCVFICFMILNNDHKVFGRLNEDNNGRLYCDSSNNEMTYQIDDNLYSGSEKMDIGNETGYRIYLDGIAGYIFGLLF